MPQRLLPYRTASFVGFVGIFLFAVVGLAHLPAFGSAETLVHGLAWIGVAAAAALMGRAWWKLAPEVFGTRMPLVGFVLLVLFVAWVWIWFAIVLVKCEGSRGLRPVRLALDVEPCDAAPWLGAWWRTGHWTIVALILLGHGARLPLHLRPAAMVPPLASLPAWG
jgi:hypothetical protein